MLLAIWATVIVAALVLKPITNAPTTERPKRFQIVDALALMFYVQLGLALGIGPWDRIAGAICVVACMIVLWTVSVGTAMHLGIVSFRRRFVLELVFIPATAILCSFTLISVNLVFFDTPHSHEDLALWHLGAIAAIATGTQGLRKLAIWLVGEAAPA